MSAAGRLGTGAAPLGRERSRFWMRNRERVLRGALVVSGLISLLVTLAIVAVLVRETGRFLEVENIGLADLLFDSRWLPLQERGAQFGLAPLVVGALLVTGIALAVALPLGLAAGIHLHEGAARATRRWPLAALELVGELPSVALGLIALHVLAPLLISLDVGFLPYNATSAGLALGLLLWPRITVQVVRTLRVLPSDLSDAAAALGATSHEACFRMLLGAARSGLFATVLLAIARALGETMIVLLAAGFHPNTGLDPRGDVQTLTSYVAQVFLGDASNLDVQYLSCYAAAFALFVLTLGLTLLGLRVRERFAARYAAGGLR